jgi:predicted RNase H-like nuclease
MLCRKLQSVPGDAQAVLGIDAAWTTKANSGVALIKRTQERWCCLHLAASYKEFCHAGDGGESISDVLRTSRKLLGGKLPDVVAVDMPIAVSGVQARRPCDDEISKRFGHAKCGTHSPTAERPGPVSATFVQQLTQHCYNLATSKSAHERALIEVYPHVALLGLMNCEMRLPYKVQKTTTYWKQASKEERVCRLLDQWRRIVDRLKQEICAVNIAIPDPLTDISFNSLKPMEDKLDALIAAWVGAKYLDGCAEPIGNDQGAIWIPRSAVGKGRSVE